MSLILKTEHELKYLTQLPSRCVSRVKSLMGVDLLQLKQGKKKWTGNNVELRDGLPLLIYSPYTKRYWYRILRADHNMRPLIRYIRDHNVFIHWTDHWQEVIKKEVKEAGLGYTKMIKERELILLDEKMDRNRSRGDYHIKKSAIEYELKQLRHAKTLSNSKGV